MSRGVILVIPQDFVPSLFLLELVVDDLLYLTNNDKGCAFNKDECFNVPPNSYLRLLM